MAHLGARVGRQEAEALPSGATPGDSGSLIGLRLPAGAPFPLREESIEFQADWADSIRTVWRGLADAPGKNYAELSPADRDKLNLPFRGVFGHDKYEFRAIKSLGVHTVELFMGPETRDSSGNLQARSLILDFTTTPPTIRFRNTVRITTSFPSYGTTTTTFSGSDDDSISLELKRAIHRELRVPVSSPAPDSRSIMSISEGLPRVNRSPDRPPVLRGTGDWLVPVGSDIHGIYGMRLTDDGRTVEVLLTEEVNLLAQAGGESAAAPNFGAKSRNAPVYCFDSKTLQPVEVRTYRLTDEFRAPYTPPVSSARQMAASESAYALAALQDLHTSRN